jgi:hypothetical protein
MSEIGTKRVLVEARANGVVGNFGNRNSAALNLNHGCHVTIELTEGELQLKGEQFIEAARAALRRTLFGDNTVMLYRDKKPDPNSCESQLMGRRMALDQIILTDHWHYANGSRKNS